MPSVDLRSDTLTLPTAAMRKAMFDAELGDDSYGGDPTVMRLESMAAERLGKEAALLVISGTMGNLVALLSHTNPGDEVILEADSHIYNAEAGGVARLGGLIVRPIMSSNGVLDPHEVENAIHPGGGLAPRTGLLCIENTHNRSGGTITGFERLEAIHRVALENEIPIHMDGARVFNASVALKCKVSEITRYADSVMFCLSKGLSAPSGSILVGSNSFIERARYFRQMVGGGMRQAGVFAAAGIVALESMVDRLAEDHQNAAKLAQELSVVDGISIDMSTVQTNIVNFDVSGLGITSREFLSMMAEEDVLAFPRTATKIRLVTRRGISSSDIDIAVQVISGCAQNCKQGVNSG